MLSGCKLFPARIVYEDVYIPLPYCPMPPPIEEPVYYANSLTPEQKDILGELAKAYVISSKESINDSIKLRMMYDTYVQIAEDSESRIQTIEDMGQTVDRSLVEQATREVQGEMRSLSLKFDAKDDELSNNVRQSLSQIDEEP